MYEQIKKLADEAVALQNKSAMEAALREISELCDGANAPSDEPEATTTKADKKAAKK